MKATTIREMCIAHHEIFNSYIEAGFSPGEAIHMTTVVVSITLQADLARGEQQ